MNEERKQQELARRMEQATAAESPGDLDAEPKRWREGWLAWGKLLDSDGELDEKTKDRLLEIPHLTAAALAAGIAESEVRKNAALHRAKWKKYLPTAAATLIVTLLLAIAMWKYLPNVEPPADELTRFELAWDDALDNRINYLETRLLLAEYDNSSLGKSFDNARWQLESLTREIEQNSM